MSETRTGTNPSIAFADKTAQFPTGRIGLVNSDATRVTPLNYASGRPVTDLKVLIRDWDAVSASLQPGAGEIDLADVEVLAPVTGRDVLCVGKNYTEHARYVVRCSKRDYSPPCELTPYRFRSV